jgi:hypothetical protein
MKEKKVRVNSSYTKGVHEKLDRLATACGTTKTELAAYLVEFCLNNESVVKYVQEEFKDTARFRLIPSKVDGEITYIIAEKKAANQ